MSVLLYGCTTWTLMKFLEKTLGGNYTRMLHTVLNKFWEQYPTKWQLYSYLPTISQTRHAGHSWRNDDSFTWTAKIYIYQLCADTGCRLRDLPSVMDGKRVKRIIVLLASLEDNGGFSKVSEISE